jgi:hypothetical protein
MPYWVSDSFHYLMHCWANATLTDYAYTVLLIVFVGWVILRLPSR